MALRNIYKPRYFITNRTRSKIGIYKNGYLRRFYERRGRRVKRGGLFRHYVLVAKNRKWTIARRFIRPDSVRTWAWFFTKKSRRNTSMSGRRPLKRRYSTPLQNTYRFRSFYGINKESTLTSLFTQIRTQQGLSAASFFSILESRIDRTLYRRRLFPTMYGCRQFLLHHGVFLNGQLEYSPRKQIEIGDRLSIPEFVWRPLFWDAFCRVYYRRWGLFLKTRRFYIRVKKKLIRLRQVSFRAFQTRRGRITSFSIKKKSNKKVFQTVSLRRKKNSKTVTWKKNNKINRFLSSKFRKDFRFFFSKNFRKYRKQRSMGSIIIPNFNKKFNTYNNPKVFKKIKTKKNIKFPVYLFYGPRTYAKEFLRTKIKKRIINSKITATKQTKSFLETKYPWYKWAINRTTYKRRIRDFRTKKWYRAISPFRVNNSFAVFARNVPQTSSFNQSFNSIIKTKRLAKIQTSKLQTKLQQIIGRPRGKQKNASLKRPKRTVIRYAHNFSKRGYFQRHVIKRHLKGIKSELPAFRKYISYSALKQRLLSKEKSNSIVNKVRLKDFLIRRQSFRRATVRRGSILLSVTKYSRARQKQFFADKSSTKLAHVTPSMSNYIRPCFAHDKKLSSSFSSGVSFSNEFQQEFAEIQTSKKSSSAAWGAVRTSLRKDRVNVIARKRLQLTTLFYSQNLRKRFLPKYRKGTKSYIKTLPVRAFEKHTFKDGHLKVNNTKVSAKKDSHFHQIVFKRLKQRAEKIYATIPKTLKKFNAQSQNDKKYASPLTNLSSIWSKKSKNIWSSRNNFKSKHQAKDLRFIRRKLVRFLRRWRRRLRKRRRHPRQKGVHRYFPVHIQTDLRTLRSIKIATPAIQGIYAGFRISPSQIFSFYASRGY